MNDIVERLQAKKRNATDEEDDALDEILLLRQRVKDQHTLIEEIGEELAALNKYSEDEMLCNDGLTVAYMSGFHDGKKSALKQSQGEPVAVVNVQGGGLNPVVSWLRAEILPAGSHKLYTSSPTLPEGWQIVPKKLDTGMESVLLEMLTNCHTVQESYDDLLAASPKPEGMQLVSDARLKELM